MGTFTTAEEILGEEIVKLADIQEPDEYPVDDSMIVRPLPPEEAREVEVSARPQHQAPGPYRMRLSSI